jgi:glycosyltransferase involved in cell wall biosynthesis
VPVVTVREKYNAAQGLVDDGVDGFVVELGDREIAAGIEKILGRDTKYKNLLEAAFQKAKKYNWSEAVIKLENSYEEFV